MSYTMSCGLRVGALALIVSAAPLFAQEQQGQQQQQEGMRGRTEGPQMERAEMRGRMLSFFVQNRLAGSGALAGSNINVQATGDTVTLTGSVPSQNAKQRAEQMAMRIQGVDEVKNQLTVDPAAAKRWEEANISDEALSKQIAQKLASDFLPGAEAEEDWLFGWEVEGDNFEFEIEVDDGDVELDGTVPARVDLGKLLQAVRTTPGVRSVESSLRLPGFGFGGAYGYGYPYNYGWGYGYPTYGWGPF